MPRPSLHGARSADDIRLAGGDRRHRTRDHRALSRKRGELRADYADILRACGVRVFAGNACHGVRYAAEQICTRVFQP